MREIKLVENTIEASELAQLAQWLLTNPKLTKGELCLKFEKEFAAWAGSKYAVLVNSGSSANLLAAYALMERGGFADKKVVVPAVSWVTTVTPWLQFGAQVEICDCDSKNLGLDMDQLEAICSRGDVAAIVLVHVLGHPNDMGRLLELCKKYNIILFEDTCEALGTVWHGKTLGTIGDVGTFSFYFGHHISTVEGGMVLTDDPELYDLLIAIRSHGWARDIADQHRYVLEKQYQVDSFRSLYTFYYPGFNLRSTEINAFLGLSQMKKISSVVQRRNAVFSQYREQLSSFWCQTSEADRLSPFAYGTFVANRNEVFSHLKENKIESRPLICGSIARQPFWQKRFPEKSLPHADAVHDYGMYLPIHPEMSDSDVKFVCDSFKQIAIPYNIG